MDIPPDSLHLTQMSDVTGERFKTEMLRDCKYAGNWIQGDSGESRFNSSMEAFPIFTNPPLPGLAAGDIAHVPPETLLKQHKRPISEDVAELEGAAALLRRCLRLDPKDRASAADLANDTWLNTT